MQNYLKESISFKADPFVLLEEFKQEPYCVLLDSSLSGQQRGRFSFFAFDPFEVYQHKGIGHFKDLRKKFQKYAFSSRVTTFVPGGIIGLIGYDHGIHQEQIEAMAADDLQLPDCLFGFYDCVLTIDHRLQKLHIVATGFPERSTGSRERRARRRIKYVKSRLEQISSDRVPTFDETRVDFKRFAKLKSNFTASQYKQTVKKALRYISQGEIYQVNLSQRFEIQNKSKPVASVDFYRKLRELSPSYLSGYFDAGQFQVISSSPERYLQLKGRTLRTQPMKGTRPRGSTHSRDIINKQALINSKKDEAELLMITDLERNDLGRVCNYGSVKVSKIRSIEEYATVFQATSNVQGKLKPAADVFDVLEACFPGGSITGCPKIRAMQIIEELEPTRRGLYTGVLGYIGFNSNMDFNILIRTILAKRGHYYFQVGGGIVADSTPDGEYQETLVKARAMEACFQEILG